MTSTVLLATLLVLVVRMAVAWQALRWCWNAGGLARVLPYLAKGNAAAQAALLDHYAGCLQLSAFDTAGPSSPQHQVRGSFLPESKGLLSSWASTQ